MLHSKSPSVVRLSEDEEEEAAVCERSSTGAWVSSSECVLIEPGSDDLDTLSSNGIFFFTNE
jgi:hypothetical protein